MMSLYSSEAARLEDLSGTTSLYLVVGDPVYQVKSVALYNRVFSDLGLDAVCVPMQFSAAQAADMFKMLRHVANLKGIVATIPHKGLLLQASDHVSIRASQIGVANIARLENGVMSCDAVDGLGYLNGLTSVGFDVRGKRAQLVGAGGAGQSIGFALAEAGIGHLSIYDCDDARMKELVTRLQADYPEKVFLPGWADPKALDLITNASPVGMSKIGGQSAQMPLDQAYLTGDNKPFVTDMVMQPAMTHLLSEALTSGCQIQTGLEALRGQARATLELFGIDLPRDYQIEL
ncbi:MAG: hypothetical protein OIF58_12955 [Cohaesibacter sp.]|nr:hypothetical protein [Cohaesibacter sp.]